MGDPYRTAPPRRCHDEQHVVMFDHHLIGGEGPDDALFAIKCARLGCDARGWKFVGAGVSWRPAS